MKKYKIIYADPPWSYNDKMSGHSFSLDHEYETQNLEWIKKLNVGGVADKDCVLFLWAVSPLLPEAFEVMNAWGFKYKTLAFCWSKITNDVEVVDGGSLFSQLNYKFVSNMGRWTMGNVELCILGVKGKPKRIVNNIKQLVIAERREHSRKPNEVRERIVQLMGDLPRLELFAREKMEGWDVFGNEVKDSITL